MPEPLPGNPVSPDGSLGLLAVGWRGLVAWREARAAAGDPVEAERQTGAARLPDTPASEPSPTPPDDA